MTEPGREIRIIKNTKITLMLSGIFLIGVLTIWFILYWSSPHGGEERVINNSAHKIERLKPQDYTYIVSLMENLYTEDNYFRKKNEIEGDKVFSYLPEKGRHGASVASIPDSDKKVAVYRQVHNYQSGYLPTNGVIFNNDLTEILDRFELYGYQYAYVKEIGMPTENILVLEVQIPPKKPGLFREGLLQYGFKSKTFENILADVEGDTYVSFCSFSFDKNQGVLIYDLSEGTVHRRAIERVIRLYNVDYPSGIEFAKINYPRGRIVKYYWENEKRFYFLSREYKKNGVKEILWRIDFN